MEFDDERKERFCLCAVSIQRSRKPKRRRCVLLKQHECSVRRGFPLGHGCRYTDAAAFNEVSKRCVMQLPKDMWVWAREGNGMTGRSSCEVALRTPPNDNEAPPEKRRNGGGDVFSGGCARRACGVAAAGRWHGGDS